MNQHTPPHCGIIVLAAGASTRLGLPKQLLSFRGTSFIRHVISVAVESQLGPVVVVLGSGHQHVAREIGDRTDISIAVNPRWREGIATSIKMGLRTLARIAECDRVILTACDQPFINSPLLTSLSDRQMEGGRSIVASSYSQTAGLPVLFHRAVYDQLLSLRGDDDAVKVVRKNMKKVALVSFPGGEVDIDTPAAYDAIPRAQRRANVVTAAAAENVAIAPNPGLRAFSPATPGSATTTADQPVADPVTADQPFTTSPPLTWITCPVINDASSDARNT